MGTINRNPIKVFLGGTCNGSKWRELLKPMLSPEVLAFDPNLPVGAWNEEAAAKELYERENSAFCLYVITPKMTGFYAIAEIIDDSNKRPMKTVFGFLTTDEGEEFTPAQKKSLKAVADMVARNKGVSFEADKLEDIAAFLNTAAIALS